MYANSKIGVSVTILAATILAFVQRAIAPNLVVLGWWFYMILVSLSRAALARRYGVASPDHAGVVGWRNAFAIGAGLAGTGWGGAGILLYPEGHLANQLFLVFVVGGMMLGAASLLAPRPEAFLAFLIPTGLLPTFRLLLQGDGMHFAMGLLAAVFTLATLMTTGRIYRTVESSLNLQFENRELVENLQAANRRTEAVNQALELRVQERTAELHESEERFRSLSNASLEGVAISKQGMILDANLAFARLFGYRQPEELIGKCGLECLFSPESWIRMHEQTTLQQTARLEVTGIREGVRAFAAEIDSRLVTYRGQEASILSCRDITERKRAQEERQRSIEQLRALAARLQSVREEERKRLAREIHDQLGQALTAIKIDLSSLTRELPENLKRRSARTSSILTLLDQTIESVRRIATDLRPGILDDLGLAAAIEWAGEEFEARTGTKCRLNVPDGIVIDPERATAVFRIFQETLTNVARHAGASEIDVQLVKDGRDLTLKVHDNGRGISESKLSSSESLGILGMKERALLLGGELTIKGTPGGGTTVRVRIPEPGVRY